MNRIICCIKQVPEVADVRFNKDEETLNLASVPKILNPFCEFAIEEAIKIKEEHGGEVVIITMGPSEAKDAIYKALAMGGDKAIHLSDPAFDESDALVTARILAEQIRNMEFDLVICGKVAMDWDMAQIGPELAELLDIPQICGIRHLEIDEDGKHVVAHRETDEGYEVVKAKLPILLTATKGLNEPRLPNIMGIMKAKKKPLETVDAKTLGLSEDSVGAIGSPTQLLKIFPPEKRKGGIKLEDIDPIEAAKELVDFLTKKGAI